MYCTNCGAEIKEGSMFCSNCGKPVVRKHKDYSGRRYKEEAVRRSSRKFNKRNLVFIIALAVAAVTVFASAIVISLKPESPKKIEESVINDSVSVGENVGNETSAITMEHEGVGNNEAAANASSEICTVPVMKTDVDDSSAETVGGSAESSDSVSYYEDERSDVLRGVVNPILSRGTKLLSDGESIYFCQESKNDNGSISRIFKAPVTGEEAPYCIYEGPVITEMMYHDGWLYFVGIRADDLREYYLGKITTDGSQIVDVFPIEYSSERTSGTEYCSHIQLYDVTDRSLYFKMETYTLVEVNGVLEYDFDTEKESFYKTNPEGGDLQELTFDTGEFDKPSDDVIILNGWIYAKDWGDIYRVRADGTDFELICHRTYRDPFVTDGVYVYIGQENPGNDPGLDKVKIGDSDIVRVADVGVDKYFMWYLNGYVNNIDVNTGETKQIITQYEMMGGGNWYYLDGWEYFESDVRDYWDITDITNNRTYYLDQEGRVTSGAGRYA